MHSVCAPACTSHQMSYIPAYMCVYILYVLCVCVVISGKKCACARECSCIRLSVCSMLIIWWPISVCILQ